MPEADIERLALALQRLISTYFAGYRYARTSKNNAHLTERISKSLLNKAPRRFKWI